MISCSWPARVCFLIIGISGFGWIARFRGATMTLSDRGNLDVQGFDSMSTGAGHVILGR